MILEVSVVQKKRVDYMVYVKPHVKKHKASPCALEQGHAVCSRALYACGKPASDVLSLSLGGEPTCHGMPGTYVLHCPS